MKIYPMATFVCLMLAGSEARAAPPAVQLVVGPKPVVMDPTAKDLATATIGIRVAQPGAARIKLMRVATNIGALSPAKPLGKSAWEVVFTPPRLQFPMVALVHADLQIDGALVRRWIAIPVSIKLDLPVPSLGAVDVGISIAGADFGPVAVGRRRAEVPVPVVIPPGAESYTINRVDSNGSTKSETKRFQLPPFARMAVVGPPRPAAGSIIRLDVFLVGAQGKPYTYRVPVMVTCQAAELRKIVGQGSAQTIYLKALGQTGETTVRLHMKQEPAVAVVHRMHVEVAETRKLLLSVTPDRMAMHSGRVAKVQVKITDLFGNPSRVDSLQVTANGEPLAVARVSDGLWRGWLYAPRTRQPGDRFLVHARAPRAPLATAVVKLLGGKARRLTIRVNPKTVQADGRRVVNVEITAEDDMGMRPADRRIDVTSEQGKLLFLHHVRPGLFRGRIRLHRNGAGGWAKITASTYHAPAVSTKVKLLPIPQRFLLTPLLGIFSNVGRALGLQGGLRFEYAVYRGRPNVHLGLEALFAPHFAVRGVQQEQDEFWGVSAGLSALSRLRIVSAGRFCLDAVVGLGVLGLYVSSKQQNGSVIDTNRRGLAVFTISLGLELGLSTVGRNEVFLQLRAQYLTGSLEDAQSENHVTLLGGLGYRFSL
ncbi:MAG: hypothetical protein ABI333_01750 [bacterium]